VEIRSRRGQRKYLDLQGANTLVIGGLALLVFGMALTQPQTALQGSLRGITVWWEVLFPALFPFFVLSELMLGFGVVHFAGTLLDPLMRPLFRLPGSGGFVVAMGFASGYPVGARLTSRLMEQKMVNRSEGERLVEMTTTSDPIFLIGAVGVGFFGRPEALPVLAIAHYGGAMLLGILGRWRRDDPEDEVADIPDQGAAKDLDHMAKQPVSGRLKAALAAMHKARMADGRPFGIMLQQAIRSSLGLMIIVGGLVVFFSAALDLLLQSGALGFLQHLFAALLHIAGMPAGLHPAFMQGTFEVTLGSRAAAQAAGEAGLLPLADRLAAAAFVLSWAGLSVHAQVAGLMSQLPWRYGRFARTRFLHGVLAVVIVYLIWPFFRPSSPTAAAAWLPSATAIGAGFVLWPFALAVSALLFIVAAGGAIRLIHRLRGTRI
jgi:sporulation integral membrane protein YlbJ